MKTFIRAAVQLNKLSIFRDLLEESAYSLTDRRHMSDLVPFVLSQEVTQIKEEIAGHPLPVIFDGTTHLGEAMAIVIHYVDSELNIQQRLIRMQLLEKSITGGEIARELISTLSVQYSIPTDMLLAAMCDCATTNNVALRTLNVVYPNVINISHVLNIVGEKFQVPNLSEFMTCWVSLFSHSPKALMVWRAQTGWPMPGYSPTRWWSKWELMKHIMELFGDVESFLRGNEDLAPATRGKLLTYFDDTRKKICLKIEMAIIVDVGSHFVKATYDLEGDGPLVLTCYETISVLTNVVSQGHYPNAQAVIRSITAEATQQIQLMQYATSCIQPGLDYFANCKENSMKEALACFKATCLFSLTKVEQMKLSVAEVN